MPQAFPIHRISPSWRALAGGAAGIGVTLALACSAVPAGDAYAITAAEKQAEADAVYSQIDSLQSNLNTVLAERDRAQAAYENACKKRDEASAKIDAETEHIQSIEAELAQFAVGMYKQGNGSSFLDVMLDAQTFEQFMSSWDNCNTIFEQGQQKLHEAQDARLSLQSARDEYDAQSQRAENEMAAAEEAQNQIESTQAALRTQAEQLSAEAAELQRQEELAAEAARQAEEARLRREAELEAAAKAAQEQAEQEERARQAAEEAAQNGGEIVIDTAGADAADADAQTEEGSTEDDGTSTEGDGADTSGSAGGQIVMGPGYFFNPCPSATSSSGFGYRTFDNSFHKGLDMAAPEGTPYYAADSGTVMYATNDGGYNGGAGNWVVISHGSGIVTKYMHSSATYVRPGDYVERGQEIGAVGNTGQSFGAHLHFQVEVGGVAVNPLNYM